MDERGLVERVDSLTAAVADLGFKLDTLISSTTAFRESFGERMTDYADLVAHWSIETEQNLQAQRRTVDRALAAQDEAVSRLVAQVEAVAAEVRGLPREGADLGPVLAEVAAVRKDVAGQAVDLTPVIDEVRKELAARTVDLTPVIDEVRKLRDEPADSDALAAVLAEVAAVRKDVGKLPRQATDVTPLLDELRQLREVLSEADVDDVEDEVSFAAALGEQLAALRSDVAALAARARPDDSGLTEAVAALRADLAGQGQGQGQGKDKGKDKADPAVVEAIVGLRADLAALREQVATVPPVPPEVTALTDALQALRSELENEPADLTMSPAPADDRLEETLAELVYEVRALRRRFPVRPASGNDDDEGAPAPRRRRRSAGSAGDEGA